MGTRRLVWAERGPADLAVAIVMHPPRAARSEIACGAVRVLLPPSEGKAVPAKGAPVALESLAHPELSPQRERLLTAVERLGRGPQKTGLQRLGIGPGLAAELERNATLRSAPAAPAADVYTGVLFQALDLATLPARARARADERLLVASALWGVVRITDCIPAYRLSMGARLPRIGGLAAWWRPTLTAALPPDGLLVDLRSQSYAAAWRPAGGPVLEVRVFAEAAGKRTVVSHMAKATRGHVARLLVGAPTTPTDPEGVAAVAEAAGLRVELESAKGVWRLDVLEAMPAVR